MWVLADMVAVMKPASCKQKGRALQNWVCELLRKSFRLSTADVRPAIMGESGMDIKLSETARKRIPLAIECKNTEAINLWKAWEQAVTNAAKDPFTPSFSSKRTERNHSW
ncbi:MAG: hypothetical protein V1862_11700 [Methanobacteriota archaeon]